jgi:small subunit ribosomal protein S3Ae
MSQKAKKKKSKLRRVSFKDKEWYTVIAPKSFDFKPIGEIVGMENNITGRTIETLLYDFSNRYEDISLKLKFKIVQVNQEAKQAQSVFLGHSYTNDYVRSLIGRGSSKIQTIINLSTKDEYVYRLTIICTTINRARSSQQIIIRKIMREILKEFAKTLNHEKFITGMIYSEFTNQIVRIAKTIYPLSNCAIIKCKLVNVPEGGVDTEYVTKDEDFEVVEVDVKRSRKSDIKRTERISVRKLTKT